MSSGRSQNAQSVCGARLALVSEQSLEAGFLPWRVLRLPQRARVRWLRLGSMTDCHDDGAQFC